MKLKHLIFLGLSVIFLILGLLSARDPDNSFQQKDLASDISSALRHELSRAEDEAAILLQQPRTSASWQSIRDSFFLLDSLVVLEWTTNSFLPDTRTIQEPFTFKLIQVSQGDFLIRKWPLKDRTFLIFVLPLEKDYPIVNNYLSPEWNPAVFSSSVQIADPSADGEPVLAGDGQCLFKIKKRDNHSENPLQVVALVSIGFSIICLLIFISMVAIRLHASKKYDLTFLSLAITLITLRIAMVKLNFPNALSDFPIFDPHRFASSSFNASMGDLMLNSLSVLILCLYLFWTYPYWNLLKKLISLEPFNRIVTATICLLVCFLALLYPYLFVEVIYHNSSISLEITDSVSFDDIRWLALTSLLVGCTSSFLFLHVFFRVATLMIHRQSGRFWLAFSGSSVLFLAFFLVTKKSYWITLEVGLIYFAVLFAGNVVQQFSGFTFKTFLYFLVVTVTLALQGALSLEKFDEERRIRDQFRFGNKFLVDQDVLGEYLLNESSIRISRDPFIQTVFASPFLSKNSARQKVRLIYLNTYFNRYDVQLFLYNASGEPYDRTATMDFADLIRNFQGERYKTAYPGIYFINTPTSEATKQYLVIVPIKRHQHAVGFVVLNLKLKKVIPRNVYPELLVDNRFSHYFKTKEFSYAVYTHDELMNRFGEFNYEKDFNRKLLSEAALFQQGIADGDYYHIAIEDQKGQFAIVTAKTYPLFYLITNFSFLFVLGLITILIVLLITGLATWSRGSRLDYAARIQLYVYLAFFLPLVTVSVTTLSLTNRSAEMQLRTEYEERSRILGEKIAIPLESFINNPANYRSENQITELAKLADLDASIYAGDGSLIVSSQPLIFENQLLSPLMNRKAWYAIVHDKASSFIADERIGKLGYNCSYIAVKSAETGNPLGVLSIPFFGSAQSLEKIQINVLANILTVFVLVFILFSILSFLVANGLTFPLRFITRSIRRTSLTHNNEIIRWDSNDEIGLLAGEYNRMIKNLEQSRIELARIQKESAWREIARQVAHEIKNPLTPMKLTLQQMEQSLNKEGLSPEKSRKSLETLLTQVEILNEIATSFSTFARMPAPELHRIDIMAVLKNIVGLHQTYPEGTVSLLARKGQLFVMGNEQLLARVFGNIILNALQSGKEGKPVNVNVSVDTGSGKCTVRFEDNGRGIDKEIGEKVFLPHFSTKKTGSGLGLAIAKQGIEQSGGRIWFESTQGVGTTFFVELPLAV